MTRLTFREKEALCRSMAPTIHRADDPAKLGLMAMASKFCNLASKVESVGRPMELAQNSARNTAELCAQADRECARFVDLRLECAHTRAQAQMERLASKALRSP